jgi:hypothetical protein
VKPQSTGPVRRGRPARRALGTLMAAFLAVTGFAVLTAQPAQALPGISDCKTAPTPEIPGRGLTGFFESEPERIPEAADPFALDSSTSIYEQYGYAGLRFSNYDLGCGPDLARSPDATVGTTIANWVLTFPKATIAATGALLDAAYDPTFLGVFDPLVDTVTDALRRSVFEQWVVLVLAAIGALIIWRSRRAPLASTASAIGWALLVMIIATVLFRWPVEAGQVADRTVTTSLTAVTGALNGTSGEEETSAGKEATANLHESLLYKAWLGGTFGDANSEVARTYGPKIFDAQALTWAQAEILRNDPERGERIIKAKNQEFEEAAEAVAKQDPDAYEYLVGRRSDNRVGYAVLAALATLCAVPFLLLSGLLVIGALIIVRLGVMLFPAIATLGMFPTMRQLVIGAGNTMASAVLNAVIFGIGSAVMIRAMGVILDPATGLPPWLNIILILLLTIVMWAALRPFRRLTRMVAPGYEPIHEAGTNLGRTGRGVGHLGGRLLGAAATGFIGGKAAGAALAAHEPTADDGLRDALSTQVRSTRAEAAGPSWGATSTTTATGSGTYLAGPPVPPDPGPPPRRGIPALGAAPAEAGDDTSVGSATRPADRSLGTFTDQEDTAGPPRRGSEAERLPSWAVGADQGAPTTVEPEDHEGEQVYVLYRPTSEDAGEAAVTDLREPERSRTRR